MIQTSQMTDNGLVEAYVNGDNKAFDELLKRHQNRLFAYINRIVGDTDVANDIFQETFMKVITTIRQGKYVDTGKFSAWLMRIAHNLIIDHFRQEKAEKTISADAEDSTILNDARLSEDSIEDDMVSTQLHEDVRRIVDALPEAQRDVLRMRFYQGMSFKEIAEATGTGINTALGRMRYAILNMRRLAEANHIELSV
ncbi:MAG: sigma-70 family RNA polymerase sigma factor [Candidatus Amulumruptor caecigallinarius]|nr:sigma-70 family RNA polymerase sigma factor [Candidatus Amulumruptor caecigallinarius]MCM1396933.1 sigma-70 family RNA polymerase sigma factor [Candidatus Amulumruptor caecigallinarius]